MATYDLQFVDSIAANPTVRLDLMATPWAVQSGTEFGMPELRRAAVSTLLTDGERYPAAAYGNRAITLVAQLHADSDDATAAALQTLYRELDRPRNILRYRPGTSSPVFFRTFRCGPNSMIWDPVLKQVTVSVPAEPFALGLKESVFGGQLLLNGTFETGISDWQGVNVTLAQSNTFARTGSYSMRITPAGGIASVSANAVTRYPMAAGNSVSWSMYMYSVAGWSDVRAAIDWYDASNTFLSTTLPAATAVPAAIWWNVSTTAVAPAGAAYAVPKVRMGASPTAADVLYADDLVFSQVGEIGNDPTSGMWVDISNVKGDVETPLIIRIPAAEVGTDGQTRVSYLAVRRRGTPANVPFLLQAESMSRPSTDTTLPGNDPVMSGTGSNYARSDFSATSQAKLLTYSHPATASVDNRGRYRVLVRVRKNTASDVITAYVRWGGGGNTSIFPWVTNTAVTTLAGSTNRHYVDLGQMTIPYGPDPVVTGYSGVEIPVSPAMVVLFADRVSGGGTFDWDHILLMPADDRLAMIRWNADDFTAGPSYVKPTYVYLDGTTNSIYWGNGAEQVMPRPPSELAGALPMLSPGATNRLFWVNDGPGSNTQDTLTNTTPVDIYYWPRYLYVAPVAS